MIPSTTESIYHIKGITVIDVEAGITSPNQSVMVVNDRIERINTQAESDIPVQAQTIDGDGLYLMPGLVDAHVHYLDAPVFGRLMIANGVLFVRDMGMPNDYILEVRDALNRGDMLGPELITTGAILDGYPPLIPLISLGIQTPEEGRTAVSRQAEAGVDMIKVYSKLDKDVFLAIVDEAQKHNLKVVGHVPDSIYIEDAAAAGLQSSEHFFGFEKVIAKLLGAPVKLSYDGMGSEADYLQRLGEVNPDELRNVYQRIRASGMTICPTVITFKVGTDIGTFQTGNFLHNEFVSPMVRNIWQTLWSQQAKLPDFIWQNWAQMVCGMNQAGIPLMVGTDLMIPGIFAGYSVHEEMAIWQEAGIPPVDVLRSATSVPAQFMGLGKRLGNLREGKTASMVLIRANPLEDIRNASHIEGVFLRGMYFNRRDLDQLLAEAKNLAQSPTSP